ncbi:MAG: peptide-methionine (S)-S-oxide reductase MsrA [Nitrospira sp.]|nr:peptide-methionine (S)-S-oxide reductase MsrA [Nitrospira sp.]MDH4244988.1 peptide-methionine (S)-S-oxide reductase MsrA [Nitrospira sp.]MDH4354452.1 peptide-methionine (S)-S-oxide reductase MsrA [Nitrospira sp.]MDH5317131.1 peptide-methionine (S)-S-oxide reductase MsrA [Nitrospira sp.]
MGEHSPTTASEKEVAILAGGCFWCLEAVYDQVIGVESVESGYIGGTLENPTYDAVCGGQTEHAEAVRITFDPRVISFQALLEIFFAIHDPTTLNRQGNDRGTQYRSAIFYGSQAQRQTAEAMIKRLTDEKLYNASIVTQVAPASRWYEAESYHQEYFARNPLQGYCQVVVSPKVAKFRKQFAARLKA